ncbi:MAG: ribonuclease P protein component [Rhodobacteraceae bacterium]|nr:ribonuclease P protein component [Paracoccaceae bacterium]
MTPPEVPVAGIDADAAGDLVAVSSCLKVLSKRADFLRAAQARRQGTPGFLLQARRRAETEPATGIRVGFTCSKKVGNAVARNRAKRRLREIARLTLPAQGHAGWDYVLVGRPGATAERPFAQMLADLATALGQVHAERKRPAPEAAP